MFLVRTFFEATNFHEFLWCFFILRHVRWKYSFTLRNFCLVLSLVPCQFMGHVASYYVGNISFFFFLLSFTVNFYFRASQKMVFIIFPNGTTGGSVQEKLTFPLETLTKTWNIQRKQQNIFVLRFEEDIWNTKKELQSIHRDVVYNRQKLINIEAALGDPISCDYDLILPPDKFANKDAPVSELWLAETLPCQSYTPTSTHVCSVYWYICQMQLGKHPVAVVQYTFTHKQYIEQHK